MRDDYSVLGKEVTPTSVDKELRLLWEADDASTKASLMNFTIYSEAKDSLLANCDAVGEITREHSCRAILMELDRDGGSPTLRSWITAHCNLAGGKKAVCCEQVAFKIDGYTSGIVRHTLFSHLESDLPLVLWWQGNFSESFRESFYSKVDRLLVDSSDWDSPSSEFKRVETAIKEEPNLVVQDLAWTRTHQFRIAFAALTDNPLVLQRLADIQKIKVIADEKYRTSALQLLAWITELSHYQISSKEMEEKGDYFIMTKPNGGEVACSCSYDATYEGVNALEVDFGDLILRIENEFDRPLLHQKLFLKGEKIHSVHCPSDADTTVELITSQLSRGSKNSLFKRILPLFLKMLG